MFALLICATRLHTGTTSRLTRLVLIEEVRTMYLQESAVELALQHCNRRVRSRRQPCPRGLRSTGRHSLMMEWLRMFLILLIVEKSLLVDDGSDSECVWFYWTFEDSLLVHCWCLINFGWVTLRHVLSVSKASGELDSCKLGVFLCHSSLLL